MQTKESLWVRCKCTLSYQMHCCKVNRIITAVPIQLPFWRLSISRLWLLNIRAPRALKLCPPPAIFTHEPKTTHLLVKCNEYSIICGIRMHLFFGGFFAWFSLHSTRQVINNEVPYYFIIHSEAMQLWTMNTQDRDHLKRIRLTLIAVASHLGDVCLFVCLCFFPLLSLVVTIHLMASSSFRIERHRARYFSPSVSTFGVTVAAVAPLMRARTRQ